MDADKDPKAQVNPAARRDEPRPHPAEEPGREERKQVKPAQAEPLDPLSPGGIGN